MFMPFLTTIGLSGASLLLRSMNCCWEDFIPCALVLYHHSHFLLPSVTNLFNEVRGKKRHAVFSFPAPSICHCSLRHPHSLGISALTRACLSSIYVLFPGLTGTAEVPGSGSRSKRTSRCGKGKVIPSARTASYTSTASSLLIWGQALNWSVQHLSSKLIVLSP